MEDKPIRDNGYYKWGIFYSFTILLFPTYSCIKAYNNHDLVELVFCGFGVITAFISLIAFFILDEIKNSK